MFKFRDSMTMEVTRSSEEPITGTNIAHNHRTSSDESSDYNETLENDE